MVYCQRCRRSFPHRAALDQHERDSPKHNRWECNNCNKDFASLQALQQHQVARHLHRSKQSTRRHHYCASCNREFQSELSLRDHRNSTIHQSRKKNSKCPFSKCGKGFVSRSAVIQHLESGGCPSRVSRERINRAVILHLDKQHIITDPSRLITGPGGLIQQTKYYATTKSWNGRAYECYFCHNTFRTLAALNQHLDSPRHEAKIYFCPLSTCRVRFTTLSGLCQHIESQKCGVAKFRAVQNALNSLVGGMRLLTL